jgi:hypothetical protein
MPCARTFKYSSNIAIPQGYNVKGAEEMDINKTNKTGSFISSAKVSGNMLAISITRTYNDNFEKTADWPLVVEMLDAASSFNNKKILFEKK